MESKYSYQFTESAKNDLEQILHYIKIDLGNPTAAFSFMNKFQEANFKKLLVIFNYFQTVVQKL